MILKADYFCSNMVANILPTDTTSTQGLGSKGQTISFCERSRAQSTMKAKMLSLHTPTTPWVGSKGHFFMFSESGHVAYQIKGEEV